MDAPQFLYLSPLSGLSSPHMNFSPKFAWEVELEPYVIGLKSFDQYGSYLDDPRYYSGSGN